MLEYAFLVLSALFFATILGFGISIFARMVDEAMDYGNYLWKARYRLASKYARICDSKGFKEELIYDKLRLRFLEIEDIDYSEQPDYMQEVYNDIAAREWMFTRWLCRKCMATYFAFWVSVCMIPLVFFSILFTFVFTVSTILATYYFTVKEIES